MAPAAREPMSVLAKEFLLCLTTGWESEGHQELVCFKYQTVILYFKHRSCSSEEGVKTGRNTVYGLSLENHVTFLYYSRVRINKNALQFQFFMKQFFRAISYSSDTLFVLFVGKSVPLHEILNCQRQTTKINQGAGVGFEEGFRKRNLCV